MSDYNRSIETLTGFLNLNNGLIKKEQSRAKPSMKIIAAYEEKSEDINLAIDLLNQAIEKQNLNEFFNKLKNK